MASLPVCFTTCLIELGDKRFDYEFRIGQFQHLAETRLPFVVYGCSKTTPSLMKALAPFTNVAVHEIRLEQFDLYGALSDPTLSLPDKHNPTKDTRDYITLMNLKTAMVQETMQRYPDRRNYGWVDFSITYICPNEVGQVQERLKVLGTRSYDTVLVPGCVPASEQISLDTPCWRFCGGFFLGDKASVQRFCSLYKTHAPIMFNQYKKIMWEVNVWALLERDHGWRPWWVQADHDLSIFPLL